MSTLVDFYPRLMYNDRKNLLDFLLTDYRAEEHSRDLVWNELRTILSRHREHSEQNWALPEKELKKIETVFNHYSPPGNFRDILYLFREDWPEFPEGSNRRNMDNAEQYNRQRRMEALESVYKEGSLPGVLRMSNELDDVSILGNALAEIPLSEEEEITILSGLTKDAADKMHILSLRYLFTRSIKVMEGGMDRAWKRFLTLQPNEQAQAAFFLTLVPHNFYWTIIEELPIVIGEKYWTNVDISLNRFSTEDRTYAIGQLQKVNRYIMLIDQIGYFVHELPTDLLTKIMCNAATIPSVGHDRFKSYTINKLFEELHRRSDNDTAKVEQLEWLYINVLTNSYSEGGAVVLLNKLSNDPDFFVEMVSLVYLSDPETIEVLTEEQRAQRYSRSLSARRLLESWRMIPGMDKEGVIDKIILNNWIATVRSKGKDANYLNGVDCEIGKLMACYPRNNTRWPSEEICEVIDTLDSQAILSHFEKEIFNSRGVTLRGLYDGGSQERSLAAYFDKMASLSLPKFQLTASVLTRLANGYKRQGKEEDERAHLDELR